MLRKGDRVMVEGRIATRGFRDREGNDRTITEIVVAGAQGMVNMLGGRRARATRPMPATPHRPQDRRPARNRLRPGQAGQGAPE